MMDGATGGADTLRMPRATAREAISADRIYLFDTTLRDGAQMLGVDFSATDKTTLARELDQLGIDYVEGGSPGVNATDDAFFAKPPCLRRAKLAAFGMTRRSGRSPVTDPGLAAILSSGARFATLVGKTWDFQVRVALGAGLAQNLEMISDSVAHLKSRLDELLFDAEHFFDGYKANPDYALSCVRAAHQAGARWLVLCDTNGGTLPHEIERIVGEVVREIPGDRLGIHCHNDTENAVANSLAAIRAGARHVQGTLNGLGERCGNANLVALIPTLMLKMGLSIGIDAEGLKRLTHVSRLLDERLNRAPDRHAAYVGEAAFAHKGGLHVSGVEKDPRSYEHVDPAVVGNRRQVSSKQHDALRAARLAQAKQYIALHLANAQLDPETVAGALKISVRQLHLLFEPTGTSFAQHVLAQRLEKCRAALVGSDRSVTEIALSWGFNSMRTFYRTFHRTYGATPGDIRENLTK